MQGRFSCASVLSPAYMFNGQIRIVKEFYLKEQDITRPKIFGMTASPVDAKVDVVKAAR